MKNYLALSAFCFSLLLFSACGSKEQTVEVKDEVPDQSIEEPTEQEELNFVFPLSGIDTNEEIEKRAIGVVINNAPEARPQSGLIDADLVYEVLAEGDITRFVAFYHSKLPERIGPIRSARSYHIDLINGYDAIMVLHGWSPEAERLLKGGKADYINGLYYDGTLFERSKERRAPHNSYITFDHILEGMEDRGYDRDGKVMPLTFLENDEILDDGVEAQDVTVSYNRYQVGYIYDEETGMFHRFNGANQTIDHESGESLKVSNILVTEMAHKVLDDVGRREVNLTSGGQAVLFQNGQAYEVEWMNDNGRIIAVKDGIPVPLKPGQTWINIIPSSPGLVNSISY